MTDVRDTSIESYVINEIIGLDIELKEKVVKFLNRFGETSRRQVARHLHLETATVASTINTLIKEGRVMEDGKMRDPTTGRTVYKIKSQPVQQTLKL